MDILSHDNVSQLPVQRPDRDRNLLRDIPDADYFVRIPDDKYVAEFLGAEGFWYRGRHPRVAMWFVIIEGDQKGARVPAYCNVKSLVGRPPGRVRQPKFTIGRGANLTAFLGILFPDRFTPNHLPSVIPEADMQQRPIHIETKTVDKMHDGCMRPAAFHYSAVKSVLGWAE